MVVNMSLSFVGGSGWIWAFSPLIMILFSGASINAVNALFFVEWMPWRWPLRWPFDVSLESGMCLLMRVMVSFGHVV